MVDRYTRGALTAIALSLSIIAVQNAVGTSAAQQTPMKVQICDDLLHCVQLTPVAHDLSAPLARCRASRVRSTRWDRLSRVETGHSHQVSAQAK